ncbi:MAG TPA: hypothetical protein VFG54_11185 [Prolixibacteraceae bacterium]|nr:hypothetical protein [Prolixibacteraceae bacterium]
MEINQRQQDKYSTNKSTLWIDLIDGSKREIDFIEVEKAIKDFCFIRHELSNYSYLYASQLSFDSHLNLPYWEYLFINGQINESDKNELKEGALLTIYLLFTEIYEAEGFSYLYKHQLFEKIKKAIEVYKPENEKQEKLIEKIKFAQNNFENEKLSSQSLQSTDKAIQDLQQILIENDKWVYYEFVEKYYIDMANSFESMKKKDFGFF